MSSSLDEKLMKNGWSRTPRCAWMVPDKDGNPCCHYGIKGEHLSAMHVAQFTVFNQRYVDDAIANWVENFPERNAVSCTPSICPSRLARLLNSVHGQRPAVSGLRAH